LLRSTWPVEIATKADAFLPDYSDMGLETQNNINHVNLSASIISHTISSCQVS